MSASSSHPTRRTRAFVGWTLRYAKVLWIVAIVVTVPAMARTTGLYLHLRSELEQLLPRRAKSVLAIEELRSRTPGLQYLGVVVDAKTPGNLPAAERFLDDLGEKIRAYPPELVRQVRTGDDEERAFLEKHAALYVDLEDLKEIRARVERRRDYEVTKGSGASLDDDEPPPPLTFDDLESKYRDRLGEPKKEPARATEAEPSGSQKPKSGRFSSRSANATVLLVEVGGFETGAKKSKALLDRVKSDVAALGGPEAYAPGMQAGYAGDVAIGVEETSALVADLSLSSVLVVVIVVAVLVLYFRWWKSVAVLLVPLFIATFATFAIVTLPPLSIRELNSNTAFLGSIIVGNGINFGIVLLARYTEERRLGTRKDDAIVIAVHGARTGTLAAALAAGTAYGSLVITDFRGFQQFGYIGGIGMALSWIATFVLMPSLVYRLDTNPAAFATKSGKAAPDDAPWMGRLANWVVRYPRAIAVAAVLVTAFSAMKVSKFDRSELEYDFGKLRRRDTWTVGEGYWGRKMDAVMGRYLTPMVLLTDDPAKANALAARLREEAVRPPLSDRIARVRSASDVVPLDQEAKIEEAQLLRESLTPKLRSLAKAEDLERLDRLLGDDGLKPVGVGDVPRTFTIALLERDGTFGRNVLVYPRPSKALWQGPALRDFVERLRAIGEPENARVAGSLPLSADILASIEKDGLRACAAALLGVLVVVAFAVRGQAATRTTEDAPGGLGIARAFLVAGSLLVGVLWLGGLVFVLGVKINFANFIAFPITLGIGVDYAVNVMSRYTQDGETGEEGVKTAIRATGGAVALCSITTIIGYGSLLLAENRALFLFGLIAVLGELACLVVGVVVLPAVLILIARSKGRAPLPAPQV